METRLDLTTKYPGATTKAAAAKRKPIKARKVLKMFKAESNI